MLAVTAKAQTSPRTQESEKTKVPQERSATTSDESPMGFVQPREEHNTGEVQSADNTNKPRLTVVIPANDAHFIAISTSVVPEPEIVTTPVVDWSRTPSPTNEDTQPSGFALKRSDAVGCLHSIFAEYHAAGGIPSE